MTAVDIKIVLLGKEFGGKTSLIERFVHNRFVERLDRNYQATIGAAYASHRMSVDGRHIVLGIWDTAGAERFESMSRLYYRNARAAIVCVDVSDPNSFDRSKFWIEELVRHEENCRLYVCATKCDLERQISAQTLTNFANFFGAHYAETSSKTGAGVQELFGRIATDSVRFEMIEELPDSPGVGRSSASKKNFCCF